MTLPIATFYYMAFASVASALLAVTRKNPVHSMLWVLVLFLHVAGIFLVLDAEFLAAVQVIVYAGAILIFYLFVLMLLDLPGEEAGPRFGNHWPFAAAVGLSFAAIAWLARIETPNPVGGGVAPRRKPHRSGRSASGEPFGNRHGALRPVCVALRDDFTDPPGRHRRLRRPRQEKGRRVMIVPVGTIVGLSAVLFGIGVFGFLARRNIILMLISVEVMLNAVNLSLAGFSRHLEDPRGQVLALFVIAVAAAEAAVGLGLLIALNRNKPGVGVADLTKLKW